MNDKTSILLPIINQKFSEASDMSIKAIRNEAEWILRQRPELHEFVMAMGSFFFTSKKQINSSPNNVIDENQLNEPEFYEMVWELNEMFNCTGFPMRLKIVDGSLQEINDW